MDNQTETKIEPKRGRGRPPKYHTEEERHAAQIEQMRKYYEKKTENHVPKPRGVKSFRTLEELRESTRNRQRRYLQRKKENK
jgi:hypothetical protein